MKAAVLVKKGAAEQAFEIREVETPSPKAGEVRVKVECFGLNYADVMARNGLYRDAPPMPSILGYESVGIVDEVGPGVDTGMIGKRVLAFTRFGSYAEYVVTMDIAVAEIGDMDGGVATCLATQYATAWYMARDCVQLYEGDKVLIHAGAGGVGTALIQLCKLSRCEIYATAGSDEKLAFMKEQGADHVINYRRSDYFTEMKKLLVDDKLKAAFNPIGGKSFKQDFKLIGASGAVLTFGGSDLSGKKWGILSALNFLRKMGMIIPLALLSGSKAIIGVNMLRIADNKPAILQRAMKALVESVKSGEIKPHVGAEFKIEDISKAHALLESRKTVGKVVVFWGDK